MSDVNRLKQEHEALNMDLYSYKELSNNLEKLKERHGDDYFEVRRESFCVGFKGSIDLQEW